MVEAMDGKGDLMWRNGIEAQLLRKELSNEAVHVFVRATLPGGVGMGEEEVDIESLGDAFMLGKLLAVIGRQRMNTGRKRRQHGDDCVCDRSSRLGRDMRDQGIARLAFIDRNESLLMTGTNHQIGLPVAEAFAAIDNGRALVDRHLVGDGAAPFASAIALTPHLLATQGAMQGAAGAPVGVDALIDGFVADTRLSIGLEVTGDLLGAPQFAELGFGKGPCLRANAAAVLTGPHAGL